ncbi:hypothetical protein [Adhaeribacter rhizoryzae]|nr:hypothetical protein [Adhaeribacter rhizoryzae]
MDRCIVFLFRSNEKSLCTKQDPFNYIHQEGNKPTGISYRAPESSSLI